MSTTNNYNRNKISNDDNDQSSTNKSTNKINVIQDEVNNLFTKNTGNIHISDLEHLRSKYNDENVVDTIYDTFIDQLKKIKKMGKKFAKVISNKYGGLPMEKILQKAGKYKKHYSLTDSQFAEFQRVYEKILSNGKYDDLNTRTRIAKTLGSTPVSNVESMHINDNEIVILQEILQLYAQTKMLHSQVMVQSMTYRDCAPEALQGIFYSGNVNHTHALGNALSHVHPIIAALFLPKIQILEEHFLYANIANIIKLKHEKKPIITKPDYNVYYDLINDPNDVVCDINNPLTDLKYRCILQKEIWDAVLNLRNGRYYNHNLGNFLAAMDACRVNLYDTPDLMYIQDEGSILRRILSAFSFRPTIVNTSTISPYNVNPIQNNIYARNMTTFGAVTAVPMITLRLPLVPTTTSIDLLDSLDQAHYYLENNTVIPKHQTIIYSKGILIFYINRRYQQVNLAKLYNPQNFGKLPMTISGFEKLNNHSVIVRPNIQVINDNYKLRSVVIAQTSTSNNNEYIVGNATLIMSHANFSAGIYRDSCSLYDPANAARVDRGTGNAYAPPVYDIPFDAPLGHVGDVFSHLAASHGVIYVYQRDETREGNELISE
jgi:hypothetical protein